MGKKLYVGGLSYSTTEQGLEALFASVGAVESVKIITDRDTGRSKGFGFVEMSSDAEAQSAIERFNGAEYDGRAMSVSIAKPMVPRDNNSRNGGGRRPSRY